jgi:hypothetical protein
MASQNTAKKDETMTKLVRGAVPNSPKIKTATRADADRVQEELNRIEKRSPATKP